jgi:hypothetical protein
MAQVGYFPVIDARIALSIAMFTAGFIYAAVETMPKLKIEFRQIISTAWPMWQPSRNVFDALLAPTRLLANTASYAFRHIANFCANFLVAAWTCLGQFGLEYWRFVVQIVTNSALWRSVRRVTFSSALLLLVGATALIAMQQVAILCRSRNGFMTATIAEWTALGINLGAFATGTMTSIPLAKLLLLPTDRAQGDLGSISTRTVEVAMLLLVTILAGVGLVNLATVYLGLSRVRFSTMGLFVGTGLIFAALAGSWGILNSWRTPLAPTNTNNPSGS